MVHVFMLLHVRELPAHAQTPSIHTRLHVQALDISSTFDDICGHM